MSIEESIDRSGSIGKRDYAMFLLATRLGLRASDIANLRFIDIDWENDEITITQYKTKKKITLPLLADIGNAIIDYLKYGRPKFTSQQVFISSRAPYKPATSSIVCGAIRGIIEDSNIGPVRKLGCKQQAYAHSFVNLKRKKGISATPLNWLLNAFTLALNDSAPALVCLFTK